MAFVDIYDCFMDEKGGMDIGRIIEVDGKLGGGWGGAWVHDLGSGLTLFNIVCLDVGVAVC